MDARGAPDDDRRRRDVVAEEINVAAVGQVELVPLCPYQLHAVTKPRRGPDDRTVASRMTRKDNDSRCAPAPATSPQKTIH